MNEIPDHWDDLDETKVRIDVETDEYTAVMHPDIETSRAYFPDLGEQDLSREGAPFEFEVAFHKEVLNKPIEEHNEEIAEELDEEFQRRCDEVFEQFDSLEDVLEA